MPKPPFVATDFLICDRGVEPVPNVTGYWFVVAQFIARYFVSNSGWKMGNFPISTDI